MAEKSVKDDLIPSLIADYEELEYRGERSVYCSSCDKTFLVTSKYNITRHLGTAKHAGATIKIKTESEHEGAGPSAGSDVDDISYDLAKTLINSDVPLKVIDTPHMRAFLSKYCTNLQIPTEADLRTAYIAKDFNLTVAEIRSDLKDKYVWLSINETTHECKHYLLYLLVGSLDPNTESKSHLISVKNFDGVDDSYFPTAVLELVQDGLQFVWGDSANENIDKVLVLVTNTESHMLDAAKELINVYPNLIHVTGFLHILNAVADTIIGEYREIEKLIEWVYEIFIKAPDRIEKFKEVLPDVDLPSEPDYGDMVSWINTVIYYADNFESLKELIDGFDPEEACAIGWAQSLFTDSSIKKDLLFIKKNFSSWPSNVLKFKLTHLLSEALQIVEYIEKIIYSAPDPLGEKIQARYVGLMDKNPGYYTLRNASAKLSSRKSLKNVEEDTLKPELVPYLKYAPLRLIDIERADNIKELLSDSKGMSQEDLEQMLIISYENRMNFYFTRKKKKMKTQEEKFSKSAAKAGPSKRKRRKKKQEEEKEEETSENSTAEEEGREREPVLEDTEDD